MKPRQESEQLTVLDVMKVRHDLDDSSSAVSSIAVPEKVKTITCDLLIVGGGTAGVAAALAACKHAGLRVCLTEETDWLGGQMSSQGVSISDDGTNFQVETSGSNRSFQLFRKAIRQHYKETYRLSPSSHEQKFFNPGNCWYWVSQLTWEPALAARIIPQLLQKESKPQVFMRTLPVKVHCGQGKIESVLTYNLDSGEWLSFQAANYVDATELGELLALSGCRLQCRYGEPLPDRRDPCA